MKQLLIFILSLFSIGAMAQTIPQVNNVPWYQFNRKLSVGERFQIPLDTLSMPAGATVRDTSGLLAIKGTTLYFLYNGTWINVSSASASIDSSIYATVYRVDTATNSIRGEIAGKVDIADTSAMLGAYFNQAIRSGDSIIFYNSGVRLAGVYAPTAALVNNGLVKNSSGVIGLDSLGTQITRNVNISNLNTVYGMALSTSTELSLQGEQGINLTGKTSATSSDSANIGLTNLGLQYNPFLGSQIYTIRKNTVLTELPQLSGNGFLTFPWRSNPLEKGYVMYLMNKNTSAFTYTVLGAPVEDGNGAAITTIERGLWFFMWDGTKWIRQAGGSSITADNGTRVSGTTVKLDDGTNPLTDNVVIDGNTNGRNIDLKSPITTIAGQQFVQISGTLTGSTDSSTMLLSGIGLTLSYGSQGDGPFTIGKRTNYQQVGDITENRNITFPRRSVGYTGTIMWVRNNNTSGFNWNIVGPVYDDQGTPITVLPVGLYAYIWDGSRWIRQAGGSTGGGSGTVTNIATNDATGITGGPITSNGTLAIDTNLLKTHASHKKAIDSLGAGHIANQYASKESKSAWFDRLRLDSSLIVQNTDESVNNSPLFVRRNIGGDVASRAPIATFENIGNNTGTYEFSNETHVRLKAGTTGVDRRRYLLFTGADNVDDWVTGANRENSYILYDANSTLHRLFFDLPALGGNSDIRSAAAGIVRINPFLSGEGSAGTGGLEVHSGGGGNSVSHKLDSLRIAFINDGDTLFQASEGQGLFIRSYTGRLARIINATKTIFEISQEGRTAHGTAVTTAAEHTFLINNLPNSGAYDGLTISFPSYNPSADNSSSVNGVNGSITAAGTNQINIAAINASSVSSNTDAATQVAAIKAIATHSGAGAISNTKAASLTWNVTNASGSVPNVYGVHINTPTNLGTVTNAFGVRVEAQAQGTYTNAYGFYSAGANDKNYFAGKVGVGTTGPAASAVVDITSTTQGVLLPRMTKAQRDAISSPATGLMVYQTDNTPGLRVYNGTNWMRYTETAD